MRARRPRLLVWVVLLAGVLASAVATSPAATSTTVVTAQVPSATTLVNGCTSSAARAFGSVQPGTPALTATGAGVCRFDLASSNDSAQLRLGTQDAFGQAMTTGFALSTTLPYGDAYADAAISSTGVALAVRGDGTVDRSTDFGMTWTNGYGTGLPYDASGATAPWYWYGLAVSPTDALRVWAVGGPGWVSRSTDGGLTWQRITSPTVAGMEVLDVEVVSDTTVFAVASGGGVVRLLRTTTANAATAAGVTWDVSQAIPGATWLTDLVAADANNVWVSADNGLWRSTNGGTAYYDAKPPGWGNQVNGVDLVSPSNVVAVGQDGKVAVTTTALNSPPTWTNRRVPNEIDHLQTLDAVDGSTWFVAGDRGALHRTVDAGVTWTRLTAPSLEKTSELLAWDGSRALLVSDGRRAAATANGTSWTVRNSGPSGSGTVISVASVRGTQVVVGVGSRGTIHRSTDLGATYSLVTSPTTANLFGVGAASADASTLYAVGEAGTALRSTDSGATWSTTGPTGTTERLTSVASSDGVTAYAVGLAGTVIRTTNGGTSWQSLTSPVASSPLYTVEVLDGTNVVLVGGIDGKIYRSTDAGSTWSTITPPGWGWAVTEIDAVDGDDVLWATASWDQTLLSIDGGLTWTLHGANAYTPYGIAAVSEEVAFISTYDGSLGYTANGGATWTTQRPSAYDRVLWDIDAIDTNRAAASGEQEGRARISPGTSIADYENDGIGADDDWTAGPGTDLFGVCLQAVGATTTPVWSVDANASCTASDGDPWRAVPNGSDKVATTSGPGVVGRVDLVWGFRPASNQPPGTYRAGIFVEALAPNV